MATFSPLDWQPGFDGFGRPCWLNKATKRQVYHQFSPAAPAGLAPMKGAGSNVPTGPTFNPASGVAAKVLWKQALAGAWKEYKRDGDGKPYWHNVMSGETTWEKPDMDTAGKPPPPPPPAKESKEPAAKKTEREADQWRQLRSDKGRRYWYNEKTGESQYDTPDCLRKYR